MKFSIKIGAIAAAIACATQVEAQVFDGLKQEMDKGCPAIWEDLGVSINQTPAVGDVWQGNQQDKAAFITQYIQNYSVTQTVANEVAANSNAVASVCGSFRLALLDSILSSNSLDATLATANSISPDVISVQSGAPSGSIAVTSNGNVGFGAYSPESALHVVRGGAEQPRGMLQLTNNGGLNIQMENASTNDAWVIAHGNTNESPLYIASFIEGAPDGAEFVLTPAGDLALQGGVASSNIKVSSNIEDYSQQTQTGEIPLDIEVDSASFLVMAELKNPNPQAGGIALRMTNGALNIDTNNTAGQYQINFNDGDNQELALDADGNLTIDGQLTTATQTVPDYVFEDGYNLMSLSELKQYISDEKHLPGIPSAQQILGEQNGQYNMTKMQISLLEKVEELTLYTLAQQEKIEEFERIIKELKASR